MVEELLAQPAAAQAVTVTEKITSVWSSALSAPGKAAASPQGLHPEGQDRGHTIFLRTGEYDDGRLAKSS